MRQNWQCDAVGHTNRIPYLKNTSPTNASAWVNELTDTLRPAHKPSADILPLSSNHSLAEGKQLLRMDNEILRWLHLKSFASAGIKMLGRLAKQP